MGPTRHKICPRPSAALVAAGMVLFAATAAPAQQVDDVYCQTTPEMERTLQQRFGATRQGAGLRGPDQIMELWSARTGDWALVARYATGRSCILAMGDHWDSAPPTPEEG